MVKLQEHTNGDLTSKQGLGFIESTQISRVKFWNGSHSYTFNNYKFNRLNLSYSDFTFSKEVHCNKAFNFLSTMSDGPYGRHGFNANANAGYGGQSGGASYSSQGGGGGYSAPSYGQSYGGGASYGGSGGQDYGSQYGSYGGNTPDNYQVSVTIL